MIEVAGLPPAPSFPDARRGDDVDILAGVSFDDPYRWLEHDDAEVLHWQRTQADLAMQQIRQLPQFDPVLEWTRRFNFERNTALPRFAGGKWFRICRSEGHGHMVVRIGSALQQPDEILFDPARVDPERPGFISWIAPSPDGQILALGLCDDGSENNRIALLEVASRQLLEDPPQMLLMDSWTGGVQWLQDSSGFFFTALSGNPMDFDLRVYLYQQASGETVEQLIPWRGGADYRMIQVSADGRHAVAVERLQDPIPVAWTRLDGRYAWQPFVPELDGMLAGHVIGDDYVAITDVEAPRGRVVAVPLGSPLASEPDSWKELVAESDAVLRTVTPVGSRLYLSEFIDTYARVRLFDHAGIFEGELPLPGRGAIISEQSFPLMNLIPRGHPDMFLFGYSTLLSSPGLYLHEPGAERAVELEAPAARLTGASVEDRFVPSTGDVRVPIHIIWPDADHDRPRPALLYAYGGWNVPRVPQFPGAMAAFVAAGGIFVHANIRGGGELGREWWEGGRLKRKQNCYEDIYAIARHLIDSGVCTAESLALVGGSNGGLMAAVAAMQRPELWGAVIPRVPFTDLIGACREPYGRQAVSEELADIHDPEDVVRLATFSPYHLVREDVPYPPMFLEAGGADPRCPAWHARKLAASLQHATSGKVSVLLHVWEGAGHGAATDRNMTALQHAEWITFALAALRPGKIPSVPAKEVVA